MSGQQPPSRHRTQQGVALITVLLVVALATVAAVQMATSDRLDQSRTGNRLALAQAHQIALGGEDWAVAVLARDLRDADDEARRDSRDQAWAQVLPPMPVEGGQVAGRIHDAQGRFNVNTLVEGGQVNPIALERFERLLMVRELDPQLAQAVVDWLGGGGDAAGTAAGAGDDYYRAREQPHLAALRPVATASELRLVRGFEAEVWHRLRPHITALPTPGTPFNVNTATPAVLQAIVPGLGDDAAESLYEAAAEEPFDSVEAFLEHPLVAGASDADEIGELRTDQLSIASGHFRVRVDVELGPVEHTLYSWLQRDDNGASRVLRRTRTAN